MAEVNTLSSAALVQGPRLPASVRAIRRTYRAGAVVKVVVFVELSSR